MAGQHEGHGQNGHEGHGARSAGAWMEHHLSGLIVPFGELVEKVLESMLSLIVNGFFKRMGFLCLVIMTPVVFVEFLLHSL